jgi:hypothetical protein
MYRVGTYKNVPAMVHIMLRDLLTSACKIDKIWLKLTDFQTFFSYFHVFQVVEQIRDIFRTNTV